MSFLVNCSVVKGSRVVYPWTISQSTTPGITLHHYYTNFLLPKVSETNEGIDCSKVESSHIRPSKDKLDRVELPVVLDEAAPRVLNSMLQDLDLEEPLSD